MMTLVASALAGGDCGDCIDDADALRAGMMPVELTAIDKGENYGTSE